jgi:hypothetical protein
MASEQEKRPWPDDPWGGLMVVAVFATAFAPVFFLSRLVFNEWGPGSVFGFFAGLVAVILWVRRYEGEWTWGD